MHITSELKSKGINVVDFCKRHSISYSTMRHYNIKAIPSGSAKRALSQIFGAKSIADHNQRCRLALSWSKSCPVRKAIEEKCISNMALARILGVSEPYIRTCFHRGFPDKYSSEIDRLFGAGLAKQQQLFVDVICEY